MALFNRNSRSGNSRSDRRTLSSGDKGPVYRSMSHGPIKPMDQRSLLERLFRRR